MVCAFNCFCVHTTCVRKMCKIHRLGGGNMMYHDTNMLNLYLNTNKYLNVSTYILSYTIYIYNKHKYLHIHKILHVHKLFVYLRSQQWRGLFCPSDAGLNFELTSPHQRSNSWLPGITSISFGVAFYYRLGRTHGQGLFGLSHWSQHVRVRAHDTGRATVRASKRANIYIYIYSAQDSR